MIIIIKSRNEASTNGEDTDILPRISHLRECGGKKRFQHNLRFIGFFYSRILCNNESDGTLEKLHLLDSYYHPNVTEDDCYNSSMCQLLGYRI